MAHPVSAPSSAPRFSARAAAVFLIGLASLVMALSGLVLAIAPSGRIAQTGDWTALGLSRPGWESLHLTMGALFLGAGGWHIALHGSVIINLLRGAGGAVLGHRRELALAGALVALVLVTALADWPPASWLADLQGWFKRDFW
ncbi:hypothetical protein LPB142_08095 [Rhodobacter xanthinilyticus]|uniref:Flavinylation-associated cytochrome domain-containing protein n=1 Tax=Rhodobacter xanthinilyticus TaxID=1850250 RepID=A0A1D9MBL6_9RHOB|nr:DUF4405 domain-containing protein [Rhodobacter xanthinilyticus]AOZ69285.1 hypothetical protein LPB142_08095 [Rhodobacter xanthinilyticus]